MVALDSDLIHARVERATDIVIALAGNTLVSIHARVERATLYSRHFSVL